MGSVGQKLFPAISTVATLIIVIYLKLQGGTWIGFWGLMTGVVWVWLSARASYWNFPIGLANAALMSYGLFVDRVFADATLYAIYFILLGAGWYQWKFGGRDRGERPIARVSAAEASGLALVTAIAYGTAIWVLNRIGGYWPLLDGLGFSLSLAAQYLLMRKYIENWWVWAAVNVLYTGLYCAKELWSFAVFSVILLAMSFFGLLDWSRQMSGSRKNSLTIEEANG